MANTMTMEHRLNARREQKLRDLHSDLADLVESEDLTSEEANTWANDKADQWFGGDQ